MRERTVIARLEHGVFGADGVVVRADAGDLAHILLRKAEFFGRAEWIMSAVMQATVIWIDERALPGRPRLLYDWSAGAVDRRFSRDGRRSTDGRWDA